MSLKKLLSEPPPEGFVIPINANSHILHIPILKVKELLDMDFISWETSKFKCKIVPVGHHIYCMASIQLKTYFYDEDKVLCEHKFTGAVTFNILTFDNDTYRNTNYSGTAESLCICNACKKLGNRYGRLLNEEMENELPTIQQSKTPTKPSMEKSLKSIIKSQLNK